MGIVPGLIGGLTHALVGYTGGRFKGQQLRRQEEHQEDLARRQATRDLLAQDLLGFQISGQQTQQRRQEQQDRDLAQAATQLRQTPGLDPRLLALPDADLVAAVRTQAIQREPTPSYVSAGVSPTGEALVLDARTGEVKSSGQRRVLGTGGRRGAPNPLSGVSAQINDTQQDLTAARTGARRFLDPTQQIVSRALQGPEAFFADSAAAVGQQRRLENRLGQLTGSRDSLIAAGGGPNIAAPTAPPAGGGDPVARARTRATALQRSHPDWSRDQIGTQLRAEGLIR